jgi:type II secretory pathway pseudopilin PulG
MNKRHPQNNSGDQCSARRGITLIECLIAVAMVAVVGILLVPYFSEKRSGSRVSRAKADMLRLRTAVEAYAVDYGGLYPPNSALDPGDPNGLNFDFKGILVPLSTPVAYINDSHMIDPFGNLVYADRGGYSTYYFINFSPSEGLVNYVWGTILNYSPQEIAALTSFRYLILSTGPDRLLEFNRLQPPFGGGNGVEALNYGVGRNLLDQSIVYDPTNGALSIGDIFLTHGVFIGD